MKQFTKSLTAFAIICTMLFGVLSAPAQAAAKKTYWLSGVSKLADGYMRMYFKNENTIIIFLRNAQFMRIPDP